VDDPRRRDGVALDLSLADLGRPIAVGRTAEVFAVGDDQVLKVLLPEFPSGMADHEAAVAGLVAAVYPFAPRLVGRITVAGRPGLVYERIDGPTMDSYVRSHLGQVSELGRTLGELHATMHAVDGTGLEEQFEALRAAIDEASPELWPDAREAALRRLEQLPHGTSVCHGDMHPGNVILGRSRAVIIDWGNARRGNSVADVARSVYLMVDTPMHEPRRLNPLVSAFRRRFVAAYLARYRELRPVGPSELRAWRLPILAARMAEGIDEERASLRAAITRELER
jgi:Ser/Thr protein kinase RdoA (MazF antagonist)